MALLKNRPRVWGENSKTINAVIAMKDICEAYVLKKQSNEELYKTGLPRRWPKLRKDHSSQ